MILPPASWLFAPETHVVMTALDAREKGASRFVGGCVRNTLLGQPVDDIDIATKLVPDEVIAAARAAGLDAIPTGAEHGTITVIANHKPYEVTTLRRDVSTDGRRATVAFTRDWDEDSQRRDFRMNAMYADADGKIFDPTGGGVEDAKAGRVQFIGDAETRIREDYLRILRFFRFFAWYGRGAPDATGLDACTRLKDGLAQLSAERVWKELKKLLAAPDPRAAWRAMEASGVRAAIAPDASDCARFEQLVDIDVDQLIAPDPLLRLAALLPDDPDSARAIARHMKAANDERVRLVGALDTATTMRADISPRGVRRIVYLRGAQAFCDRARLAWAQAPGDPAWRALIAMAMSWPIPRLPLTGEEIMATGAPPGPKVGEIMRAVEGWWIDNDFPDDKMSVLERMKAVAREHGAG
jgi:poly(A) polymerase